jgi:hypothetical protein
MVLTGFKNEYYSGSIAIPVQYGAYGLEVTCASSEYDTKSSTKSFTTSKRRASLSVSIPSSGYYGQSIKIVASYEDAKEMKKIPGACRVSFDGKVTVLASTASGYDGDVAIPYAVGTRSAKITCESTEYETLETSRDVSAANRPAEIKVISPSMGTVFYPTDEILLEISYGDKLLGTNIAGASCAAGMGGKSYPLAESGKYYGASLRNQSIGQQTIQFKCSKAFYGEGGGSVQLNIIRIPINIMFTSKDAEFRSGEEIRISAKVVDNKNNDADAGCSGRADVYDLSFNRLVSSKDIPATKTSGGWVLNVTNPGEPSRIRVTMSCSGDIFEEKSAYTDVKIKMLGKQTEEGMTLFLAVTTIILLALTFLIRKRLKII